MDVVLVKDVEKLGPEGTVVHVKPGFARNYLLPRGLAVPATPQQLKIAEAATRQRAAKHERAKAEAMVIKQKLEARSLTLTLNVGEDDKTFGSVTAHEIAEALKRDGLSIEKHALQLEEPIKSLGVFEISVRIQADVTATLKVSVVKA